MPSSPLKRYFPVLCIIFLTAAAFFNRLDNCQKGKLRTIDELVYFQLGQQHLREPFTYNSLPIAKYLHDRGRGLPDYFTKPLFKHPPLHSLLIALSFKLFGENTVQAVLPTIILNVLMIPLTYLLGSLAFDRRVGLFAAFFIFLDPVNRMSAHKIWMDSTLAFFVVLSIYLYAAGLKYSRDRFFLWSGVAAGLAVLTKYPGILATLSIFVYTAFYQRQLLRNKNFLFSLVVPLIMFLPWLYWNFVVYGGNFLTEHSSLHNLPLETVRTKYILGFIIFLVLCGLFILGTVSAKFQGRLREYSSRKSVKLFLAIVRLGLAAGCFIILRKHLVKAVNISSMPETSWTAGFFQHEPVQFYFGRLIEFSILYIFSFMAILLPSTQRNIFLSLYAISSMVILVFFSLWGGFQSRYILYAIPFLIILGVQYLVNIFEKICAIKNKPWKFTMASVLVGIIIFIVIKTLIINHTVSDTNDYCYF